MLFFIFFILFFFGVGGWAQLQCIYYLVLYTDLQATEGISEFQTSLFFIPF